MRIDRDETCREAYSSYKKAVIDNRVLCVASINAAEEPCKVSALYLDVLRMPSSPILLIHIQTNCSPKARFIDESTNRTM